MGDFIVLVHPSTHGRKYIVHYQLQLISVTHNRVNKIYIVLLYFYTNIHKQIVNKNVYPA